MDIPVKTSKEFVDIVARPLTDMWKCDIILGGRYSFQLKVADIRLLQKKFETIKEENYAENYFLHLCAASFVIPLLEYHSQCFGCP